MKNKIDTIALKNIDLTGTSKAEQLKKCQEEQHEFYEALGEYISNPVYKENRNHVIDELLDEFQAKLGLIEKEGIKAEEVQAYYSTWIKKLEKRPRNKLCSKCTCCEITEYTNVKGKSLFCHKSNMRIIDENYAKECKYYEESEE